jgi:PAS domain S-box-containing protein
MESQVHLQDPGTWRFKVYSTATVLVVVAIALVLSSGLPIGVRGLISGIGLVAVGLNVALACAQRARQSTERRRRRAFALLTLACLSAAAGNVGLMLRGASVAPTSVSPSDIALVLTLVLATAAVIYFPLARRRGTDIIRMGLDGVVIGGSILAVTAVKFLPAFSGMEPATVVVNLAIPVVDVVVATLATLLFMRGSAAERPTLGGLAVGFALYAGSDLLYVSKLIESGSFALGTPIDLGWIGGYAMIAWAIRSRRPDAAGASDGQPRESSAVLGTATVFAVFLVAGLVSLVDAIEGRSGGVAATVLWTVVLLAVLGRQFFLVLDNEQLRLTLEQRVVERTRSLRQVTRRSDLLVNSVGDGIYGVDRFGLVTFVNPAAAAALGHEAIELIGRDAHQTFHAPASSGELYPHEHCYIAEAIRDGVATNAEEDNYLRVDGREIPVEVTCTPLTDDGVTLGAVVVFRDVTQRREVDRLKNEFVSMVSHELRTPLTAIRGSLGLLAGEALGPLTPPAARMVEIALVSSERLTRLINEILDLERMEAGALPLELGDHDVPALVNVATGQASVLAQEAGVTIRVVHVDGAVRADADRVVQTLLNLLGNAIKFSEPGQEVTLSSARRGQFVEFEVADSGRGIPEDKLDAVFARFQQVDSSDAREKGGSGLGLAISRSIVERLGGRIWAANNPGGGTVFRFTLPAAPTAPDTRPPALEVAGAASDRGDRDRLLSDHQAEPASSAR